NREGDRLLVVTPLVRRREHRGLGAGLERVHVHEWLIHEADRQRVDRRVERVELAGPVLARFVGNGDRAALLVRRRCAAATGRRSVRRRRTTRRATRRAAAVVVAAV